MTPFFSISAPNASTNHEFFSTLLGDLQRLVTLRDAGVLSLEEFDAEKAAIINGLLQ